MNEKRKEEEILSTGGLWQSRAFPGNRGSRGQNSGGGGSEKSRGRVGVK